MPLSPKERSLRAKLAAHSLHAQGGTSTAAGTAAFLSRFERQVDPDGLLMPEERSRRAEHAKKAYMSALALKSSKSRRKRASTPQAA